MCKLTIITISYYYYFFYLRDQLLSFRVHQATRNKWILVFFKKINKYFVGDRSDSVVQLFQRRSIEKSIKHLTVFCQSYFDSFEKISLYFFLKDFDKLQFTTTKKQKQKIIKNSKSPNSLFFSQFLPFEFKAF